MRNEIQSALPSTLFKPFICYYKYIESDKIGLFKIVPIPYVELYFNFTHINIYSNGYYDLDNPRIHLAGLHQYDQNSFSQMFGTDRNGGFAIVFEPQGFYNLFKIKSSDFYSYCINGESVFKKDIYHLWEHLQSFHDVNDMKKLFESHFQDYAKKCYCRFDLINDIISYIGKSNGMIRLSQICNIYNITPRSLERHFRDEIGISPKELLQIFRINNAIKLITDNPEYNLTSISYLSGYYDQSHFIKDIKQITGISPRNLQGPKTSLEAMHNRLFVKTS